MKIKRVLWRNITSYGNKVQTIDFEENPGFYMLMGENASGKSSFLSCITFGLFGKVSNKKLKDLANRKNKNGWVRIELESNGHNVIIERGVSPTTLEVTVDGKRYDESGKKNVQEYLEEEIYGIPYYVFDNLISLNINDFKSFISMSPSDKRSIIDKLFSLDLINQMRELLKVESKETRSLLEKVTSEIEWTESSIEKGKAKLKLLENKIQEEKEVTLQSLIQKKAEVEEAIKSSKDEKDKIQNAKETLQEKKTKYEEVIRSSQYSIKTIDEKIQFFSKEICPTCQREMTQEFSESKKDLLINEKRDIESGLKEVMPQYEKIIEKWNQVQKVEQSFYKKDANLRAALSTIKSEVDKINLQGKNTGETESLLQIINEYESSLVDKEKERSKTESLVNFHKVVDVLLSEKGIKQLAIQSILPILNKYIKELSIEMNVDYDIYFDEEFNAVMIHLGEEISPASLSTGEAKKVDIVVLLALIKLIKIKFSQLNILFLDEVFSSVDMNNIYHMIRSLGKITRELKLNTIVVNHSILPHEEFDYILRTDKKNGFSSIELEKVN